MKTKLFYISFLALTFCVYGCKYGKKEATLNAGKTNNKKLHSIYINGDSIHYLDIGKGEPVVFVHGGLGDYRTWAEQIDTFSSNYRVIAYSRRYAYPNKQVVNDSADYTVLPHVKDLATLISTLKIAPVHLVGHSWGAFTALKATIDHPELIKSLVVGEPPVQSLLRYTKGGDSLVNNLMNDAFEPAANAFKNNLNEKGISYFIGGVMGDSLLYSKVSQKTRDRWLQNTIELRGHVINRSFIEVPASDIKAVTKNVLILKGDRSPLYLTAIADQLHQLLPNSELIELQNSSHGLQGENPTEFNKIVLAFIRSNALKEE